MRRGWLLLLCAILFLWQPLRVAAEFQLAIGTLGARGGVAIAELLAHAAVAALSVAAALALWNGNPAGPALATYALVAGAAASIQSLYWTRLPHQTVPGERLPLAALATVHAAAWIFYLRRGATSSRSLRPPPSP